MDDEDRAADLIAVLQDRLIDKALAADNIPTAVGVQGTGMVAASGLIIIIVILNEERCVFRQRIDDAASQLILTVLQVFKPLSTQSCFRLVARFFAVCRVKISLSIFAW